MHKSVLWRSMIYQSAKWTEFISQNYWLPKKSLSYLPGMRKSIIRPIYGTSYGSPMNLSHLNVCRKWPSRKPAVVTLSVLLTYRDHAIARYDCDVAANCCDSFPTQGCVTWFLRTHGYAVSPPKAWLQMQIFSSSSSVIIGCPVSGTMKKLTLA